MKLKITILTLILFFSFYRIYAQKSIEIDSLTNVLSTIEDNDEKVKVLNRLMVLNRGASNEKAFSYGYQALALARKIDAPMEIATLCKDLGVLHVMISQLDSSRHYYNLSLDQYAKILEGKDKEQKEQAAKGYIGVTGNLGNWFFYKSMLDSSIYYHQKTIELSDNFNMPKMKGHSYHTLGVIHLNQGKYEIALDYYLEALANYQEFEDLNGASRVYSGIGNIHLIYTKKYDKALEYFKETAIIKKKIDGTGLGTVYNRLGVTYTHLNQLDSASYYINESMTLAKQQGNKRLIVDNYSAQFLLGTHTDISAEEGIANSLEMIQLSTEINYPEGVHNGYGNLAESYQRAGNYGKAASTFEKAISMAKERGDIRVIENHYGNLYKIYKTNLKDSKKALAALENQFFYKDSLRTLDRTQQVEQLTIQFETEQKEKEIALLEKDKAVATAEIQQRKNQTMTAALGALGLLLLAGFLYFRFRYVRKVNEELDRLNTTKDRLFAIVSHDLRGSISAFQNIGQIINFHLKKGNYDRLGVVANQVDKSANNLNNLLDNLLQWSLSQLEGVDLNPTKLNVRRSVDDIVELFEQNAAAKGTNLQSFIKEDLQAIVDENSLHLVLRNLVSNAIKFTSEGDKIEIHGVENDKFVELSIKDTGTGIPQEKMARIFQIDSKTSSKGTSGERGTGLGLALCKEFVERNGGTIELKSVLGEGTVCQFRLPKAI